MLKLPPETQTLKGGKNVANFEEKLKEKIKNFVRERGEEDQKRNEFESKWETRRTEVLRILEKAANVITAEFGESKALRNSGGVVLGLSCYELRFSLNKEKMQIFCKSTATDDIEESYNLESLTNSAVELKIVEFVRAVINKVEDISSEVVYTVSWG